MPGQSIVALLHVGEQCGLVTIGLMKRVACWLLAVQDARSVDCSTTTCWERCGLVTIGLTKRVACWLLAVQDARSVNCIYIGITGPLILHLDSVGPCLQGNTPSVTLV
jgi:hypothetical protein